MPAAQAAAAQHSFQEALGSLSIVGTHPEIRLGIDPIDRTGAALMAVRRVRP
jgi:hypothetical protein